LRRALNSPGAAFLDRDGTINVKAGGKGNYVERPEQLVLLAGAAPAVRRLNDAGLKVIVITNQRGIALGRMTHEDLDRVHARMSELLASEAGAHVDDIFYCPHEIDACDCRKPDVGLFLQAKERWPEIDLAASAMVGDSENDVIAGRSLGMTSIWLGTDAPDLAAAVDQLLESPSQG
jgi:D-glycero-D-manno-heptose 1,7-bisphosphate phosphatase